MIAERTLSTATTMARQPNSTVPGVWLFAAAATAKATQIPSRTKYTISLLPVDCSSGGS